MKIAFHKRERRPTIGPYIFQERLIAYLKKQKGVEIVRNAGRFHQLHFTNISGSDRKAKQWKAKSVLRIDGIWHDLSIKSNERNQSIKDTYHSVDGVIFQCDFSREMVYKYFGKPRKAKHQTIIHNGVNTPFAPEGEIQDFGFDHTIVVSGSWPQPSKRLGDMIDCFLALDRKDIGLVVLGKEPKKVKHPRIRYCGFIQPHKLPSYYRGADIMFHFAYTDWCPNVVIEALACGTPVITTHNGGVPELIKGSGIIIRSDSNYNMEFIDFNKLPKVNPELVNKAVNAILEAPKSFRHERPDLTISHCGQQYLDFFRRVLNDR